MKSGTSSWKYCRWPTPPGSLKQATGIHASGLPVLAVIALVVLAAVQSDWVSVWTVKHGRIASPSPTMPPSTAANA